MPGGCARERRGWIFDPQGYHFGYHFGVFFGIISHSFLKQFLHRFLMPFWTLLESISESFWKILVSEIRCKSLTFQRTSPGALGHRHRAKTIENVRRVVQNRGSTFSRRGASGSGFGSQIDPKWTSKSMKKLLKTYLENRSEICSQKCPKMRPK